jgi:hypothetical protein
MFHPGWSGEELNLFVNISRGLVQSGTNFRGESMSLCVGRARSGAVARKIVRAWLLWCCVAATVEPRARGQSSVDGAISGFVVDAGGPALVGAVVQVQNVADGTMTRATTEGKGEFLVAHLPAGEYRVEVEYVQLPRFGAQFLAFVSSEDVE